MSHPRRICHRPAELASGRSGAAADRADSYAAGGLGAYA